MLESRGFTALDFRNLHPGGRLGALLTFIRDLMHTGSEVPLVPLGTKMSDALVEMSAKGFGCVAVTDAAGKLAGVITDGDLRRHMGDQLLDRTVAEVMHPEPKTITANRLAGEDETLTAWHYRPAALTAEMLRSHYALQALLYSVALHRYLRWRLADYDPDRDLAGVYYLFVRGVLGRGVVVPGPAAAAAGVAGNPESAAPPWPGPTSPDPAWPDPPWPVSAITRAVHSGATRPTSSKEATAFPSSPDGLAG